MTWTQQQEAQYLSDNRDVAAAIRAGTMDSAFGHFTRHGQSEGRFAPGTTPGTSVSAPPQPAPQQVVGDPPAPRYPSLYNEMRGTGVGSPDVDYSNSPVSTAPFRNAYHYVRPNGDTSQLISAMRNGNFRFNPDFYAANNADLGLAGIDTVEELMQHYATHGFREGRAAGVGDPIYANATQTQAQAAAGVDPIANRLVAMGGTPNWTSSGTENALARRGGGGPTPARRVSSSTGAQTGIFATSYPGAQTVEDRIANILNRDSTLMRQAATQGRQRAAQRGILNSSISVGAAQQAVTDAAHDIASQDSAQRFASDQNNANRALDVYRQDREIAYQTEQRGLDRASNEMMQQREIEYQTVQRGLDRENQELIAEWNLDSTDRANAVTMLTNMSQLYASRWQSIMGNTNFDAETRTAELASINALRDSELDFVRQLFNVQINW